jgi:teichuronic acid biosynthesis glycosyltransferase TuaC
MDITLNQFGVHRRPVSMSHILKDILTSPAISVGPVCPAFIPPKILTLSTVYPNPNEPGLGLFVRARLQKMASLAQLKVIAPIPAIDYQNPLRNGPRRIPPSWRDEALDVFHPRWAYPPGGSPVNIPCLYLRLLRPLARLRREFPFQLIDAQFGYPEGVVAALLARSFRCPFTVTLRGSEPVFAGYRYRRRVIQWALRRADAVIAVSEPLRDFAISLGVDPSRVHTIPNGIDRNLFFPRDRSACRTKFGIASSDQVIACAGELIEAKGHHLVVRAVDTLVREGRNIQLFIAGGISRGGAPFEKQIRRIIADLGLESRVRLLGWTPSDTLAELMSAADVFCLASFTEGWPNVVNEALACGAPVVASNVGAVPDMIPAPDYGSIVPPKNQLALTGTLRGALSRSWDRPAIASWGQSRPWDQVASEVISAFIGVHRRLNNLSSHVRH